MGWTIDINIININHVCVRLFSVSTNARIHVVASGCLPVASRQASDWWLRSALLRPRQTLTKHIDHVFAMYIYIYTYIYIYIHIYIYIFIYIYI
jgi:hypothetical protein